MYQALYRKYRPADFNDVCGQEHITAVLKSQLCLNRVSHAYMFCGSRGTGKTSCAKILAKAVNCENLIDGEPCNKCPSCLGINEGRIMDVVEMDAASNNGVDNIRRLCDEVMYLPAEVKKRVYIIDEVHMLSGSAFNALLKTLEEPPEHVLFILATTEMHAIPATIMSRCQRFDFKRIRPGAIIDRILKIAALEGIQIEREAAAIIAKLSDGAMRDALSLLEACTGQGGLISAEVITKLLGLGNREMILDLLEAVAKKNPARCLYLIGEIYDKISDFKEIIAELIKLYRDLLVLKYVPSPKSYVDAYEKEYDFLQNISELMSKEKIIYHTDLLEDFYAAYDRISSGKKASCEILFIKLCSEELSDEPAALSARIGELERLISQGVKLEAPQKPLKEAKKEGVGEKPADPKPAKEEEPKPAKDENKNGGNYEHALKLKNLLQKESLIKPYLSQVEFVQKGNILYALTGKFIKGILLSTGCDKLMKTHVLSLSPEIVDVVIDEKPVEKASPSNDFDGL